MPKYRLRHYYYEGDYPKQCTHIVFYANVRVLTTWNKNATLIPHVYHIDISYDILKRVVDHRLNGKKVLATLDGFDDLLVKKYGNLLSNAEFRNTFVVRVAEFMKLHLFNGLELNSEVCKKFLFQITMVLPPDSIYSQ